MSARRPKGSRRLKSSRSWRPTAWVGTRRSRGQLRELDEHLASARSIQGKERDQVIADLTADRRRMAAARTRLMGDPRGDGERARDDADEPLEPGVIELQVSWEPGRVVAWAAGPGTPTAERRRGHRDARRRRARRPPGGSRHAGVPLPGGAHADAFAIPVGEVLGWLVAAGAGQVGDDVGPSVRWLGRVAIWAVELTARGAMVPLLRQRKRRQRRRPRRRTARTRCAGRRRSSTRPPRTTWPTRCPAASLALDPSVDARALTRSALTGMVDAICRDSAAPASRCPRRRRACAPRPTSPRRSSPASTAARSTRRSRIAGEIVDARSSGGPARSPASTRALIVRLDPPDERRRVAPRGVRGRRRRASSIAIEQAIVDGGSEPARPRRRAGAPRAHAARAAAARRHRRGQVVLSQDEAWELMADDRAAARGRRLRRARPRAVAPQADAVAARVRRRARRDRGRRQPARRRALVGGVRRRRAHRRRHRASSPRKRAR